MSLITNNRYLNSINFLESLINIPGPDYLKQGQKSDRSFFIKRLKFLLKILDNPEKDFKYIHVTGTSGKGSVVSMIQSILNKAGLKTGAYFSPHPTEVIERIKVSQSYIPPTDFSRLMETLKPYLAQCAIKSPYGVPSYFETFLALAFLYFKEKKCQYVILETGLGGSFDATNVIKQPQVAIITNIDLDHTHILGRTKEKIAKDKAGIIKRGSTLITGEQNEKILKILKRACQKKKCFWQKVDFNSNIVKNDLTGMKFKYKGNIYETKIFGKHQVRNAILAIEAADIVLGDEQKNPPIRRAGKKTLQYGGPAKKQLAVKDGLAKIALPCRLEVMQKNPTVILDSAHNPDKMKSTADFMKNIKPTKLHLIVALAETKDLYNTLKHIVPLASHIYLTRFLIAERKSKNLKDMYDCAKKKSIKKIEVFVDPWRALNSALKRAKKEDMILITGSLFLAGELRKKWIKLL